MKVRVLLLALVFASACEIDQGGQEEESPDPLAALVDQGCADIFQQGVFPNYELTIAPATMAELEEEFLNRVEREAMDLDLHPYHPIQLRYGAETTDAMIRLKGQSSWLQTIAFDANPKMQFVISFNEVDPAGRFHGQRKIEFDMTRTDGTFLRQRAGLYFMRRAGIVAQCANNATLTINGELYGLYTHLERLDKEFLQRNFEGFADGDLWKGGVFISTNEETYNPERINAFWEASSDAELATLVDLEASIASWAAEAMAAQGDGYYNGRANFFLYDHPTRGFIWIPHDLDSSFDYLPADASPLYPTCQARYHSDRKHWGIIMSEPSRQVEYVDALTDVRKLYEVNLFQNLIAGWAYQIYGAADADPNKPFSTFDHELAVQNLIDYPVDRASTIDDFIECRNAGGVEDADGDGFADCFECDDQNADVYPGAPEMCNGRDDNCDGLIDETELGMVC